MQKLIVWRNREIHADCSLDTLREALQDNKAVSWLDLQVHTGKLEKYADLLTDTFKLSALTIDTIQEERERARLVEYRGYFYLVVHGMEFYPQEMDAKAFKLDIIIGRNFLVTIHRQAMSWLDEIFQDTLEDTSDDNIMGRGMPYLLHAALDHLVDSYFPMMESQDQIIDELEIAAMERADKEVQANIFRMKRTLAYMRRVISPQVEVANALVLRTGDYIPTEAEPYFADLHDHLIRIFETLDSQRDLLSGLLDVYQTTVSNRMNEIMKQLAIISTIFLPITFVSGVFGQNFGHSPQVDNDSGFNFWLVLFFMLLVTALQLWYFRRRKWI
jgi:magnesium transporter